MRAGGRSGNGGSAATVAGSAQAGAPRLVIGFAFVVAVAAFLGWSGSPTEPTPHARRLASHGLVTGRVGQAENLADLMDAAAISGHNSQAAAVADAMAAADDADSIFHGSGGAKALIAGVSAKAGKSAARGSAPLPEDLASSTEAAAGGGGLRGAVDQLEDRSAAAGGGNGGGNAQASAAATGEAGRAGEAGMANRAGEANAAKVQQFASQIVKN